MLDGVDDISWDQFPGPEQYEPDSVVPSLHRLAAAQTFDEAEAAYTNVLFAAGNNHAGTLYPASQAALPFVLAIGLEGNGWAKWGALQTLTEFVLFSPDYGPNPTARESGWVALDDAIRDGISNQSQRILEIVTDQSEYDQVRLSALDLLSAFGGIDLYAVVIAIETPNRQPNPLPGLPKRRESTFIDSATRRLSEAGCSVARPRNT